MSTAPSTAPAAGVQRLLDAYPQLQPMSDKDLPAVAEAFSVLVPDYFLSQMGTAVLARTYWRVFCRDPRSFGFVWMDGEKVVGFVSGTTDRDGLLGRVLAQSPLDFGLGLVRAAVRSPKFVKQGVGLMLALRKEKVHSGPDAELMSLGVLPRALNPVIGPDGATRSPATILLSAASELLRSRHVKAFRLYTGASNRLACAFYRRLGLTESHRFQLFGEEKVCFVGDTALTF